MRASLILGFVSSLVSACGTTRAPAAAPEAAEAATAPGLAEAATAADREAATAEDKEPVPRFERVDLGTTGLSAYMPRGFPPFDVTTSQDGSTVHSGELRLGGFTFACIALRLKEPLGADDDREGMLVSYLDFLKTTFGVTQSAGYGRGHTVDSEPLARGVIDYWDDADKVHYAVKGWVTLTHLAVLMVYGPGDYPYLTAQQAYLDGIRFAPAPK